MNRVKFPHLRCPYCGSNAMSERIGLCVEYSPINRFECLECGLIMVVRRHWRRKKKGEKHGK